MRYVDEAGGRLVPDATRGLAHLARAAGALPTALATARTLDWPGWQNRVLGDIHFAHGDMDQAAPCYTAARAEAEQHGNLGEQAIAQAHIAPTCAFTAPDRTDDEITLAQQLLAGLDQRATALTAQVAVLARDAWTLSDLEGARVLRAEIDAADITAVQAVLELALVIHHPVTASEDQLTRCIALNSGDDYGYYNDIAHFMAGLPLPQASSAGWIDGEVAPRQRWRHLVTVRQGRRG
ncbi:hypothetical protein OG585_07060 [Streptomyces sp. NBC_01340]|uniref:hypothetical protein n=1 Tax=unclassified Streptomyces TaxID=2593676 RepID=UPI00224EFEF6|nr:MULTISPECIES: hypothetical protein [unclassified Streptomyces]MCX4452508.1 hypothetical protein [Streptomyces sp. NBC_01719]MCX4491868.1 hypothetical protein [Streptomyces sp. NBC_01728]MCX4593632.1 hypothetical protein [Streptomyces sp. NBC_01549]WSI37065.1 hypothetical protein OG585_07060 [Streptomyces sp. NBC_01340]